MLNHKNKNKETRIQKSETEAKPLVCKRLLLRQRFGEKTLRLTLIHGMHPPPSPIWGSLKTKKELSGT